MSGHVYFLFIGLLNNHFLLSNLSNAPTMQMMSPQFQVNMPVGNINIQSALREPAALVRK